jgi:hypothetical protein
MNFARIDTAINLADKQMGELTKIDPQLQAFVVGYLVLEIVSEFETRIEQMFVIRAKKTKDTPVSNFVGKMLDTRFRRPAVGKIKEFLGHFDTAMRICLETEMKGTQIESSMDSLLTNRDYYVHKEGNATLGFQGVKDAYVDAVKLFDCLAKALGLSATDLAHLT